MSTYDYSNMYWSQVIKETEVENHNIKSTRSEKNKYIRNNK